MAGDLRDVMLLDRMFRRSFTRFALIAMLDATSQSLMTAVPLLPSHGLELELFCIAGLLRLLYRL